MFLISKVIENNALVGFLVGLRESVQGLERAYKPFMVKRDIFEGYVSEGEVEGFEGDYEVILSRYSSITKDRHVMGTQGLVVVNELRAGDRLIGVECYDAVGLRYKISYKKLERLCMSFVKCNFELASREDGYGVVGINGFNIPVLDIGDKVRAGVSSDEIEAMYGLTPSDDEYNRFGRSAQEKLTLAKQNLFKIAPYFHTVLNSLNRVPAKIGTMGVTEDTLYYDLEFVAGLTVAECTFVLIHEMMHILMQHSIRFAGRKSHKLWNIATDLYINTLICNDFGALYNGVEVKVAGVRQGSEGGVIKALDFGVFAETVGLKIDLKVDSPESIYAELYKENEDMGSGGSDEGEGKGAGSGKGKGKGSDSGGGSGSGDGSEGKGGSSKERGSGKGEEGAQGKSDENGDGSNSSAGKGSGVGDANITDLEDGSGDGTERPGIKVVNVKFRGKELKGAIMDDIRRNRASDGSDEVMEQSLNDSRMALQRVKTRIEDLERKGEDFGDKVCGLGGSLCKRSVDIGLGIVLDWRVLCKNLCKVKPKKMYTLGSPQRDYMTMGLTLPGRERLGKPTKMTGIKFAVDVSGSVSKSELDFFLSELGAIFQYYDVSGELIYWSDGVGNAGDFKDMMDMLRIEPVTTGGTNVIPLFQYLQGEIETDTGVVQKTRVRDITGVFILTDGCFSMDGVEEYGTYFGRKVVWIIAGRRGNILTFQPPFGEVVELEIQ